MATITLPPHIDEARARLALAIGLFQEDAGSVGEAAEIAGLPYRGFLNELSKRGIPAYVYDDEADFAREMETVRSLDDRERRRRG